MAVEERTKSRRDVMDGRSLWDGWQTSLTQLSERREILDDVAGGAHCNVQSVLLHPQERKEGFGIFDLSVVA